jgi:hypothetical protein
MGHRRENRWSPPEHPEQPRPVAFSLSPEARGGNECHAVNPMPVWAWVRFPTYDVRVKAFARSWTIDAVLVEWAQFGQHSEAWVWRSAVKHRSLREDDRRMDPKTDRMPSPPDRARPELRDVDAHDAAH